MSSRVLELFCYAFFFFNDTATTEIYTLSLHDALPISIDRQCSSGLMAIATAAKEIVHDGMTIAVGGGLESVSLVQNDKRNQYRAQDPWLVDHRPDLYMTMIETA